MNGELVCPTCGEHFYAPGAEELAFNSTGACKCCGGTGMVRTVDRATLIPDENKTIDEGAVAPWNSLMWSLMTDVCREMGVRTDVPVQRPDGAGKRRSSTTVRWRRSISSMFPKNKNSAAVGDLDMTYYSATATVLNALNKVKDEKGMKRVEKFLKEDICPECHGTRLSEEARAPRLMGISLADACRMTLKESVAWVKRVPEALPEEMRNMAEAVCESYLEAAARAHGFRAWLSDTGSGIFHALHGGTAADAACKGCARPHDRRSVCSGRAFHWFASGEHRRV